MLVKGKELNRDNVQDWSDMELHMFEYALKNNLKGESHLLYRLVKNEQNRRTAVNNVNNRFRKNAEFLIQSLGGNDDR